MKQYEVQWALYQRRLADIRLSVKRYKGPSEHDTCVQDLKFLLGEVDRLAHMVEMKQAALTATSQPGGTHEL